MLLNTQQSTGQPPTTENYPFQGVSAAKTKKPAYKQQMQHLTTHACHWWDSHWWTAHDLQTPNPHGVTSAFLLRGKNHYLLNNIKILKVIVKAIPPPTLNNLTARRKKGIDSKIYILY